MQFSLEIRFLHYNSCGVLENFAWRFSSVCIPVHIERLVVRISECCAPIAHVEDVSSWYRS